MTRGLISDENEIDKIGEGGGSDCTRRGDILGPRTPIFEKNTWKFFCFFFEPANFFMNKPIGASPDCDYVLTRMVLQIILYSTRYGMIHQKRGGTLRGLWIKREREEYVDILILRKPH